MSGDICFNLHSGTTVEFIWCDGEYRLTTGIMNSAKDGLLYFALTITRCGGGLLGLF